MPAANSGLSVYLAVFKFSLDCVGLVNPVNRWPTSVRDEAHYADERTLDAFDWQGRVVGGS
jgi:hypothetical protein